MHQIDCWRTGGCLRYSPLSSFLIVQLKEAGDEQRALELNKFMGLQFGPENRLDPIQVLYSNGVMDAGYRFDPQTNVLTSPAGQSIDANTAAYTINQQGPAGLHKLMAEQNLIQQQGAEGVRRGTHEQYTAANGQPAFRAKLPEQLRQEQAARDAQTFDSKLDADIASGAFQEGTRDLYLSANGPGMLEAYNRRIARSTQPPAPAQPTPGALPSALQPAASQPPVVTSPVLQQVVDTVNQNPTPTPAMLSVRDYSQGGSSLLQPPAVVSGGRRAVAQPDLPVTPSNRTVQGVGRGGVSPYQQELANIQQEMRLEAAIQELEGLAAAMQQRQLTPTEGERVYQLMQTHPELQTPDMLTLFYGASEQ